MARAGPSRGWRPEAQRRAPRGALGLWGAFVFNICLVLLPAATAAGFFVVARDHLYTYNHTEASGRAVRAKVETIAGELILLDFDRQRQWDDLVAMELIDGDISAARGFLLSARAMLPPRDANELNRTLRAGADDAEIELAALELLTPGTRARYESLVPLLSRRAASGAAQRREPERFEVLGDARDFELLAGAMLADANSDPLHFTLTGLGLGLGGTLTPRMSAGASALLAASRRPDFADRFAEEITAAIGAAAPADAFRAEALRRAEDGADAASFPIASAAFRAVVDARRLSAATAILDEIGAMSEATSPTGAALLVTHARSLSDLPRLRLVAQSAGDRATAAAKRAPRDGRLQRAASGALVFSQQLIIAMIVAALAALGLALSAGATSFQAIRLVWADLGHKDRRAGGDLVQSFDRPWRAL
jgi:hypothetical protein